MNLLSLLPSFKQPFSLKNAVYLILIALILTTFFQCRGNRKLKTEITEMSQYKTDYNELSEILDSMIIEQSTVVDDAPQGNVIFDPATGWENEIYTGTSWEAYERERQKNAYLLSQLKKAIESNKGLTQDDFESGELFEWTNVSESLPIIETVKRDTGKNFVFEGTILSRGLLEGYRHNITVTPEILRIKSAPEIIKEKADSYIALMGGILFFPKINESGVFDNPVITNANYTIGLQYSDNRFIVDVAPILSSDFKLNGIGTKVGVRLFNFKKK